MFKFIQETLYFMLILFVAATPATKPCSLTNLNVVDCGKHQQCFTLNQEESVGSCQCENGYEMANNGDECVQTKKAISGDPSSSSLVDGTKDSHVAAAIIVPMLLITIVICGVFVGYKYKVVSWVRGKLNQRSTNYDEVMIGQDMDDDDPPLR